VYIKDDLLANMTLALQLIGQYCGSAAIGEMHEKDSPHFQPILDTTWKSLADDYCVGWIKALEATGKLCDEQWFSLEWTRSYNDFFFSADPGSRNCGVRTHACRVETHLDTCSGVTSHASPEVAARLARVRAPHQG